MFYMQLKALVLLFNIRIYDLLCYIILYYKACQKYEHQKIINNIVVVHLLKCEMQNVTYFYCIHFNFIVLLQFSLNQILWNIHCSSFPFL